MYFCWYIIILQSYRSANHCIFSYCACVYVSVCFCVRVKIQQQATNYLHHYFRGLLRPSMSMFPLHEIENYFYFINDNYNFSTIFTFWPDGEEAIFEKCMEILYFITYLLGNTQWLNRIYGLLFMILNAFFGMQNYIRDMVNHNFITYNGRNCILGFAWTCHL